jgi:hypothetical protein
MKNAHDSTEVETENLRTVLRHTRKITILRASPCYKFTKMGKNGSAGDMGE